MEIYKLSMTFLTTWHAVDFARMTRNVPTLAMAKRAMGMPNNAWKNEEDPLKAEANSYLLLETCRHVRVVKVGFYLVFYWFWNVNFTYFFRRIDMYLFHFFSEWGRKSSLWNRETTIWFLKDVVAGNNDHTYFHFF